MINEIVKILDKAVVQDLKIYDTKQFTPYFDYVIICSVTSTRQGHAAMSYLRKNCGDIGYDVKSFTNTNETNWFLVDLNDVIVHIFVGDERKKYNLDGLYSYLQ